MLAHVYQIWPGAFGHEWDKDDPVEKRYVGITTVVKRDRESAFEIFNELLAMRLGQLIGLPIPSGIIVERDGNKYFASCHVLASGGQLPPADFTRFANEMRRGACGVMVFDAWVANTDRHNENLWYDYYSGTFVMFDHGRALLGGSGRVNLLSQREQLGVRVDENALSREIVSFSEFPYWYDRIIELPAHAIRDAARDAASVGVDHQLSTECATWLLQRRALLPDLFRNHITRFPRLELTLLDPFGGYDHVFPEYCI